MPSGIGTPLHLVKIVMGIAAFLLIPGYMVIEGFSEYSFLEKILLSLVIGMGFQIMNVLLMFSIGSVFLYHEANFAFIITTLTFSFATIFTITKLIGKKRYKSNSIIPHMISVIHLSRDELYLILILALSFALRLYYQTPLKGPTTDGALYLEMARWVASKSTFSSNVITASNTKVAFEQYGFTHRFFTYFMFAIFYLIGGIEFSSAELALALTGTLVVFLVYEVAKEIFDDKVGVFGAMLASLHPLLLIYSLVPFGPEIMGTLYLMTTIHFFWKSLKSNKSNEWKYAVLFGFFLFSTNGTANYMYWALIATLPILSIIYISKGFLDKVKGFVMSSLIFLSLYVSTMFFPEFYLYFFNPIPSYYWLIYWSAPFLLLMLFKSELKYIRIISISGLIVFILTQLAMVRIFYFGHSVEWEVQTVTTPVTSLPNSYLMLFVNNVIPSLINYLEATKIAMSLPIVILSLASLLIFSQYRQKMTLLCYPALFLLLLTFYPLEGLGVYDFRPVLSLTPFIIILAAYTIVNLARIGNLNLKINFLFIKCKREIRVSWIDVILLLMFVIFLSHFIPIYDNWKSPFYNDDSRYDYWKPAVQWINENTGNDAVLMSRKPFEFAWLTDRKTILPAKEGSIITKDYYNVSIGQLIDQIWKYKVNYLIVDENFYTCYKDLAFLKNPSGAPFGFDPVLDYEYRYSRLIVYNVTKISSLKAPPKWVAVSPTDDAYTYGASYASDYNTGNFSWLYVGKGSGMDPLRIYLKFNLSSIPEGKEILRATLVLHVRNILELDQNVPSSQLRIFCNYVVDDNFNEKSLTHNNRPASYPDVFNVSQNEEIIYAGQQVTWDVTQLVKKEYSVDRMLSLVLHMDYLTKRSTMVDFFSKESMELVPILVISYS
jgi:hypothetical protein